MNEVVEIENVSFRYEDHFVLENVFLTVNEGDFLGVIGPNGSGKTTMLKIILGLLHPSSGQIRVFGRSPRHARHLLSYVPQNAQIDRLFPVSVQDVVLMGRLGASKAVGRYRSSDVKVAHKALAEVDLDDLSDHRLGTLSGGQRQRVLIARALASQPRLLLLDEPTSSVDSRVELGFYELLKKLNETVTILLVSHDLGFVSTYVNRVACVNRRLVVHRITEITGGEIKGDLYDEPMHRIEHVCRI
ncbi:MAG: ABC transporter ATP-binding protein [Deltaproteobacteria bacterium]|nr:ABC transporter ATP-binding protein [Deltaproteobacteria bacterium]MBW2051936.1 ABC transporter ATP-binding protein [Deltaproteobacteria bacterium]MBW2139891.1 ABC transporter ATP-binding protein [Deltaproteobacteria bacterium]MBW2322481.1 ABC transporter ATP-binding protein [Deltaproteobacteria bacterium]